MANVRRLLKAVQLLNDPLVRRFKGTDSNIVCMSSFVVPSAASAQVQKYCINL